MEGNTDTDIYTSETENRYKLEPYLIDFAEFESFVDLNVLEIGVGMGSDHSQIAFNKPRSLTGIDLTERAIEHTKKRFKTLGLTSSLKTDNAESLSFEDNSFDAVYSWGVLHHSPNTKKCFEEVWRVLKPEGIAKIMIYHKHSPIGWMLWIRYGLMKFNPFISLADIYSNYLESPGTKAYTINEAEELARKFSKVECKVQQSHGDLLEGNVGARHRGIFLTVAKIAYPRRFIKMISKVFPFGLCLLITLKK